MMQARLDGADRHPGDFRDLSEREVFENMEQERGSLRIRKRVHQSEERFGLFVLQQQGAGIRSVGIRKLIKIFVRGEQRFIPSDATPLLHNFLVSDAEEPRCKTRVVTQRSMVSDGRDKRLLDDIEGRTFVAQQFSRVGIKRELVPLEQGIPCVRCIVADGVEKVEVGRSHEAALPGRMKNRPKGSIGLRHQHRWPPAVPGGSDVVDERRRAPLHPVRSLRLHAPTPIVATPRRSRKPRGGNQRNAALMLTDFGLGRLPHERSLDHLTSSQL